MLDAAAGQNGLEQARVFTEVVDVTGVVLTKLDGTAKGGIVIAVRRGLEHPGQAHRPRRGSQSSLAPFKRRLSSTPCWATPDPRRLRQPTGFGRADYVVRAGRVGREGLIRVVQQEVPLIGGNTSTVVRVGDTVRRNAGPWTPAVHSLLHHLERVGFTGAPRALR